ncbi:MAG: YHS domain-containing (seleno)protein [Beijerinckiaceae bacterium]
MMAKLPLPLALALPLIACLSSLPTSAEHLSRDPAAQLVADARSGLAIFGYDPVAYHLEGKARSGLREHSASHGSHVWLFVSAANRAGFLADPAAYIPSFGGHDGAALAEGALAKGDPAIFVIAAGDVVMFRSTENRDRYAADIALRRRAVANWPEAVRQLAGH